MTNTLDPLIHGALQDAHIMALYQAIHQAHSTQSEYDFRETLLRLIANWDRQRTEQIASLQAQLVDALMWSAKPMRVGNVS
jgi:hypothetical protein